MLPNKDESVCIDAGELRFLQIAQEVASAHRLDVSLIRHSHGYLAVEFLMPAPMTWENYGSIRKLVDEVLEKTGWYEASTSPTELEDEGDSYEGVRLIAVPPVNWGTFT